MKKHVLGLLAATLLMSSQAFAGADCVAHPKEQWLNPDTFKKQLTDEGYKIKVFKVDGNCYEVYGRNKEGKKVEVYFDTVTGKPVKTEAH